MLRGHLASAHAPGAPAAEVRKEEIKEEVREEPATKDAPATPRARRSVKRLSRATKVGAEVRTVVETRLAGGAGFDWNAIHRQIADECLAGAKAEFQKKEGAEFDHCYIGQQIMAHAKLVDELKVLRTYASVELRKTSMRPAKWRPSTWSRPEDSRKHDEGRSSGPGLEQAEERIDRDFDFETEAHPPQGSGCAFFPFLS